MPPESSQTPNNPPPAAAAWWKSPGTAVAGALGWAKGHRLQAGLIAGAGLLSLAALVAAVVLWPRGSRGTSSLQAALQALDEGDLAAARRLADEYQQQTPEVEVRKGGPDFVRGAAAAYEAVKTLRDTQGAHYQAAAKDLQQAWHLGFPPGRQEEGLYLLGTSLFSSGQLAACRPVLRECLLGDSPHATEIHWMLAEAFLHDATPHPAEAEEQNDLALVDIEAPPELRHRLTLQRAEILLAQGKVDLCQKALDLVPADSPAHAEADVLRARILFQQARKLKAEALQPDQAQAATARFQQAIELLRQVQATETLATDLTGRAMFLIGQCLLETGDAAGAAHQFGRVTKLFPQTPEAFAASFEEADLSRATAEPQAVVDAFRRVLRSLADVESYNNPWLPLADLRRRVLAVYQEDLDKQRFAPCTELAQSLYPLFPRDRATELLAESCNAWGHARVREADHLPAAEAEAARQEGRDKHRLAGRAYRELAQLLLTQRRYPDELWNSVQAYLLGHDYHSAVTVLRLYLENETRKRHAEALAAVGEALLSLGQTDEALTALTDCIDRHPRDAAAFRARLLAARADVEKADYPAAEKLLRENLGADLLTPASSEWRESLFDLGRVLHTQRRFEEAIPRLEEAVARYEDQPRAVECAYLAADAWRQQGHVLLDGSSQTLVESTRLLRIKQADEALKTALERFQKLRETLLRRQENGGLSPLENALLRNCYYGVADLLFDLGRFDEALRAYTMIINRYQNRPETMQAYLQITYAYQRLERPADARATAEQAKLILNRIKGDETFLETTNYTAGQWQALLEKAAGT